MFMSCQIAGQITSLITTIKPSKMLPSSNINC